MSTRPIYQCPECSKQYYLVRDLKDHLIGTHGWSNPETNAWRKANKEPAGWKQVEVQKPRHVLTIWEARDKQKAEREAR